MRIREDALATPPEIRYNQEELSGPPFRQAGRGPSTALFKGPRGPCAFPDRLSPSAVSNRPEVVLFPSTGWSEPRMRLTRASSYALHAVAYMAQQKSDRPIASHKIAQERGIPERFLLKVLKPLVSARVLTSIKGPNGGYKLARPATEISVLEIVEAVDGPIRGQAPPPEPTNKKKYPQYKPENSEPLYARLDSVCQQTADQVRKQIEK